MHAHYMIVCIGSYLSLIWSNYRDQRIYGIRRTCLTSLEHIIWPENASLHACTLCAYMHRPISQPNWVGSERSKYLWNQENMPDLSEHMIWPKHTSLHACMLWTCVLGPLYAWELRPISQSNWVRSERWRYLWNWENIPHLSEYIIQPKHAS